MYSSFFGTNLKVLWSNFPVILSLVYPFLKFYSSLLIDLIIEAYYSIDYPALKDVLSYITFVSLSAEEYRNKILKLYECPLRIVRWCCISDYEKDKCREMKNAFASRQVKPDLDCVSGKNAWHCMEMVKSRLADLVTLDPADAYRGHRYFGLRAIAAEDYGTATLKPVQYAVAVVKRQDLTTNLWNLRTKRACGTSIGDMAGWHVPVDYLISIKELYVTSCMIPKVCKKKVGLT